MPTHDPTDVDLDVYGDDEHPAAYDDTPTPILPDDPDWARRTGWHLRQLARLEQQLDRTEHAFDQQIIELRHRRDFAVDRLKKRIAWHTSPLEGYHAAILAADPTAKTVSLPGGELASRTPRKPTLKVEDRDAFITWCINQDDAEGFVTTETVYQVERSELVKRIEADLWKPAHKPEFGERVPVVDADGVVIPGISLGLGERTFTVHTDGSEL